MSLTDRTNISIKPQTWVPHISIFRCVLLALATLAPPIPAHSQGCAQCRDNAAATPPATQAAYRHAIELLVVTAASLFVGTVFLLKRSR
jgi:hypothetical protein